MRHKMFHVFRRTQTERPETSSPNSEGALGAVVGCHEIGHVESFINERSTNQKASVVKASTELHHSEVHVAISSV